ncbi:vitamin K epoxide reductase family protein [Maribacter sp. IgM3_T14_3]|uniref:vitamin K epoxide reductase family protein n=1 Tax=Maribacter sp. IgM3_T14_3 TaxID=3415140 RepID=UPI003C6EBF9A
MFQKKSDSIAGVLFELFKSLDIQITAKSIQGKLLQHPHYPSLFSISNTISNFGIENKAVRITSEQLEQVETPFLATTKFDETILVKSVETSTISYYTHNGGDENSSITAFLELWNNMVVLMDNESKVVEKDYSQKKNYDKLVQLRPLVAVSAMFGLFLAISFSFGLGYQLLFLLLKLGGLTVSLLLVSKEILTSKEYSFCKAGKKIDCNEVLNSPAAQIFSWLSMTDLGFLYFSGTLLALINSSLVDTDISDSLLLEIILLAYLSIPYTIYSLVYQAFKIKKWCILCLGIITVLWTEAIVGYFYITSFYPDISFQIKGVLMLIISLLIPTIIWMYLKNVLIKANRFDDLRFSFLRITNNIQVFQFLQQQEKEVDMELKPFEVVIGNINTPNTIVLALNPFCPACGREYNAVQELLLKQPTFAKVVIRFVGSINSREDSKNYIASILIAQYKLGEHDFNALLSEWFNTDNRNYFAKKYELQLSEEVIRTLEHHYVWSDKLRISITPTAYLNGKKLPEKYTVDDLNSILSMNY